MSQDIAAIGCHVPLDSVVPARPRLGYFVVSSEMPGEKRLNAARTEHRSLRHLRRTELSLTRRQQLMVSYCCLTVMRLASRRCSALVAFQSAPGNPLLCQTSLYVGQPHLVDQK